MYLWLIIVTGLLTAHIVTAEGISSQTAKCEDRVTHHKALQMSRGLLNRIEWEEWELTSQEVRASNSLSVNSAVFRTQFDDGKEGEHFSSASFYSPQKPVPLDLPVQHDAVLSEWGIAQFRKAMNRALDFVIPIYSERRTHWPKGFLTKLRALAHEYEHQSTYINIENKPWPNRDDHDHEVWFSAPPEVIASIRLIVEKNGQVPMESYLDVKINARNKIKIEPGNFAISREANEVAWVELAIMLLIQGDRLKMDYGKEPLFVTYADEFSEELYKNLGFKYFEPDQIEASNGILKVGEDGHIRIEKDGIMWAPLYATVPILTQAMYAKVEKIGHRRGLDALNTHVRNAVRNSLSALASPATRLGFYLESIIWEVDEMLPSGHLCPSQSKRYDSIAYQVSGRGGYVCMLCDFKNGPGTPLVVAEQVKCNLEIKCHAGICN